MKFFHKNILKLAVILFCINGIEFSIAQNAEDIMVKVDSVENFSYNSSIRIFQFTSCRYEISQGRLQCKSKPRLVRVENIHEDYIVAPKKKDARSLHMITSPISDRGTIMLVWENADKYDNDCWMYLPVLGKVKRVVTAIDGDDPGSVNESGSVFGTQFSFEDVSPRKIKDYTYKFIGEDTYRGRPVWKIESTPTALRANKTFYSKVVSYVDKERFIRLKDELYNHQGNLYKQLMTYEVQKIDGVWIVTKSSMNNLVLHSITNYDLSLIAFNLEIDDELFTQRSFTDFSYRERKMSEYRKFLKKLATVDKP